MDTTDATRTAANRAAGTSTNHESKLASSPVRLGVEWGYPISLVRKLLISFVVMMAGLVTLAHIFKEPGREIEESL